MEGILFSSTSGTSTLNKTIGSGEIAVKVDKVKFRRSMLGKPEKQNVSIF